MADTLVAYFSRSGTTEKLARELARRLGADLEPIRPEASYAGAAGFRRGVWQSLFRRAPAVAFRKDPSRYRLVVLASPVWAGRLSTPMIGYLKANRGRIGPAAAVCVSGSGGAYRGAFRQAEKLVGRPLLSTLPLGERDVLGGAAAAKLGLFVERLHPRPYEAAVTRLARAAARLRRRPSAPPSAAPPPPP